MISILSPAKKLNFERINRFVESSHPTFSSEAFQLAQIARKLGPTGIGKLMKLSPKLADLNDNRFNSFKSTAEINYSKQAIFAFAGDTYVGFDAESLDSTKDEFVQKHIRILSGLYGVLRPFDLIQPYRLEMGSKLENPKGKNLYQFWEKIIIDSIKNELRQHNRKVIIYLASDEYFKALGNIHSIENIISPKFFEKRDGEYKLVSFYAKKARGLMARFIVNNEIDDPNDIKGFNIERYRFEREKSDEMSFVFSRES